MPEGAEVDTDKLHETIHERFEQEGGAFLKTVALTTAVFAASAAIASLQAGATINEALLLKTESTRHQAEASDQWTYYQAKGIKCRRSGGFAHGVARRGQGGAARIHTGGSPVRARAGGH